MTKLFAQVSCNRSAIGQESQEPLKNFDDPEINHFSGLSIVALSAFHLNAAKYRFVALRSQASISLTTIILQSTLSYLTQYIRLQVTITGSCLNHFLSFLFVTKLRHETHQVQELQKTVTIVPSAFHPTPAKNETDRRPSTPQAKLCPAPSVARVDSGVRPTCRHHETP